MGKPRKLLSFSDNAVSKLDPENSTRDAYLLFQVLCGEPIRSRSSTEKDISSEESISADSLRLIDRQLALVTRSGLTHPRLNEVLLLMQRSVVSDAFFRYFFLPVLQEKGRSRWESVKAGVIRFRGYAMLCFGSFSRAYSILRQIASYDEIVVRLMPYSEPATQKNRKFDKRHSKSLQLETIPRNKTVYVGELTVADRGDAATSWLEAADLPHETREGRRLSRIGKRLDKEEVDIKMFEPIALRNTKHYLVADYVDLYVATSMREVSEFEEAYDFVKAIRGSTRLRPLRLNVFDPTQSKCANPRDKGLLEMLMLKRALCTVYMLQDKDTMGKDSELAITLAQGKPVIVYVKQIQVDRYARQLAKASITEIEKRILQVLAQGKLKSVSVSHRKFLVGILSSISNFILNDPFSTLAEYERKASSDHIKDEQELQQLCHILASALAEIMNRRAHNLIRHPLGMQVGLSTGVANGVIVVRSVDDCAEILYRLLTLGGLEFEIEENMDYTSLLEAKSRSVFRVVTKNSFLANAFWNRY